jgi:hypothetical protein
MTFKMPKPVFRLILGVFLISFVVSSCGNKKSDKAKEATKDSLQKKPTDGGN